MSQCAAKSKRSGEQCKRYVSPGSRVCNIHGGLSLRGVAHPGYIHGRYSKDLAGSGGLLARYQENRLDVNATALADEIAILRARAGELLKALERHESGATWGLLRKTFRIFREASAAGNLGDAQDALNAIGSLIEEGAEPYQIWSELNAHLGLIANLVRIETVRETRAQESMTAQQAVVFKTVVEVELRTALQRHCDDATVRAVLGDFAFALQRAFARQSNTGSGGQP